MKFRIYQLPINSNNIFRRCPKDKSVDLGDYVCVWNDSREWESFSVAERQLDVLFSEFNNNLPEHFSGHSMSVSDIVEIFTDNERHFYYCDSFGWEELNNEEK